MVSTNIPTRNNMVKSRWIICFRLQPAGCLIFNRSVVGFVVWAQVLFERRHFFSWLKLNGVKNVFFFDGLSLSQICSLSHHPPLLSLSPDAHWSWQLPAADWSSNPDTPSSPVIPPSLPPPRGDPAAWLQISWKPAACHHTVAVTQRETRPTVHIHIQSTCNNRPPFISDHRQEASGGSITWRSGVRCYQAVVSLTFPPGFKGIVPSFGVGVGFGVNEAFSVGTTTPIMPWVMLTGHTIFPGLQRVYGIILSWCDWGVTVCMEQCFVH